MQKMQMEISAQQIIMDNISSMQRSQEVRKQRQEQQELQQQLPPPYIQPLQQQLPIYTQPPTQPPQALTQVYTQQLKQQPPRSIYTPPMPPANIQTTLPPEQAPNSSPIVQPYIEDEVEVIQRFFNWKIGLVRNPQRRLKWERAKEIAEEQD